MQRVLECVSFSRLQPAHLRKCCWKGRVPSKYSEVISILEAHSQSYLLLYKRTILFDLLSLYSFLGWQRWPIGRPNVNWFYFDVDPDRRHQLWKQYVPLANLRMPHVIIDNIILFVLVLSVFCKGCPALLNQPSVYASVAFFRKWIDTYMTS